jgi:hypothetical protein
VATISLAGAVVADDPLTVTVQYQDETGLNPATISLGDLMISTAGPAVQILSQNLQVAPNGLTATATYSVLPQGGWTTDQVTFTVANGAIADTSGNTNTAAQANYTYSDPSNYDVFVFAVNAGGPQFTTAGGVTYQADNFGVGNSYTAASAISGTVDDALYQSETWKAGGFIYDVPVENGTYRVELNFAEIYWGTFASGARVFDVFLEDQLVFNNLDIFAITGGANSALVLEALVEVTDGALTLSTGPEVENPKISAFSIWADDLIA